MVSIQIDDQTAQLLEAQARRIGVSVSDYLRGLIFPTTSDRNAAWDELESKLLSLSSAETSLPNDFSRADIYGEHN